MKITYHYTIYFIYVCLIFFSENVKKIENWAILYNSVLPISNMMIILKKNVKLQLSHRYKHILYFPPPKNPYWEIISW